MADVQYPAGQGAPAQAALPVAQGIQPADELAAQAAGGQVAQVVQQVVGQDALPAAEHVAQEIQQAAPQVPQQAVGQAQPGELETLKKNFADLQKSLDELTRLSVAAMQHGRSLSSMSLRR
ncbi:uncharacterized protein LOC144658747 [Oculina patagonica]